MYEGQGQGYKISTLKMKKGIFTNLNPFVKCS